MARRRASGFRGAVIVLASFIACAVLASCGSPRDAFVVGTAKERAELRELFALLDSAGHDPIQRFAAVRQISADLLTHREYGRLTVLLTGLATRSPQSPESSDSDVARPGEGLAVGAAGVDPYSAWYLFTAAFAYERQGDAPIAAIYYDRIIKNWPDLIVDGRSIHFECLSRLIETVTSPERRIEYYKDLLARFPDRVDMGRALFLLAKEYERVGDWDLAIKTYARFLPYFGASIQGYPDAFQYARNVIDFYNSPKDWAYADLQALVAKIKAALAANDAYRLRGLRAKVNFFAVDWNKDEIDANSQALFDFGEFMSGRISSAETLDPGSGPREAFLKTWGWSDRISTWYLYFRKIYFPADPEIHGRWEWAGIYFGERMR